jgi:LmbE family N-acetylglucosaminyl deacetylase
MDLGDCRLENSHANRQALVAVLRRLRPGLVITHDLESRHPDHRAAHELVRDACFFANVGGFDAPGARHKISALVFFLGHEGAHPQPPDWIVDISAAVSAKTRALRAYGSQFYSPRRSHRGPQTYLSSPGFWHDQENRSRHWGHLIGVEHGEPFALAQPAHADHPFVRLIARLLP